MEDKVIQAGETKYSLRKCLGEEAWEKYCKASEKVQSVTEKIVQLWCLKLEET